MTVALSLALGWIRVVVATASAYDPSASSDNDDVSNPRASDSTEKAVTEPDEDASDNELMRRYAEAGDVDAFEQLVHRYEDRLLHYILKRTDGDRAAAEDLLQETFVRVVDNADGYEPSHAFSTWLYTIARNLCIDRSRSAAHRKTESLDAPIGGDEDDDAITRRERLADDEATSPGVEHDREAFRHQLSDALDDIPEEQKEVFLLREVSGLTFPEIAEVVDVAIGTVKSRMRYALQSLRRHLEDFEDHDFDRQRREATGADD